MESRPVKFIILLRALPEIFMPRSPIFVDGNQISAGVHQDGHACAQVPLWLPGADSQLRR